MASFTEGVASQILQAQQSDVEPLAQSPAQFAAAEKIADELGLDVTRDFDYQLGIRGDNFDPYEVLWRLDRDMGVSIL